ncbi:MAG: DNA polymerase III subunit delta [Clostridia bacterium]|nr:DNA polymerase III subunit delta [Clostridia bacterium]
MAVIFEESLKKSLKSDGLLPVYILFGEDAYLKTHYLNKISKSIADSDDVFNYSKFVTGCDLQGVYDAVMQMPMMSDRKCVILNDYDFEHCSKAEFDRLTELISAVPKECTLILYFDSMETDHKKGAKFKNLISACEKNGGVAVCLNHRGKSELVKMLCDGAAKRGCKMDFSTGNYLVETAGEDINLLSSELTKLCAFVREGVITKADIDEVCTKTAEADIFKLSDFILSQNSTEALKMLDELFFMRTEPMSVLYTVSGVFTDMYRVFCAKAQSLPLSNVIKSFGYPKNKEFLVEKASKNLRKMDFEKLQLCLETLVSTDRKLKSFSSNQRGILEEMIIKLIYIIGEGKSLD